MTKHTTRRQGRCYTSDFQADCYGGQYTLVERVGPGQWLCADLPPSETEIEDILTDPTLSEDLAQTIVAERWQHWGEPYAVRFISAARYAEYF
jgi:hypothetical protein